MRVRGLMIVLMMGLGWSAAWGQPAPSLGEWSSLGGDAARTGRRATAVGAFGTARWVLSETAGGEAIGFTGAGVAASAMLGGGGARVFVSAVVGGDTVGMAVDAEDGSIVWTTPIPAMVLNSWSPPTLDGTNGTVLFASGSSVVALRADDGSEVWRADLDGPPVDVGVAVTDDLGVSNRAFVTSYGGFGGLSRLTCLNVSPRRAGVNPFDPGDVVWSVPIGSSVGGTPAYLDGVVFVCSTGLDGDGRGEIRAFDARATSAPEPLWLFTNPVAEGFFGGLCVRERAGEAFVYAASYAYFGGLDSANLVKVDAGTGGLLWSVSCNRTSSIPVVLDGGRVALAGGLAGFGSVPTVELFTDHGTHATREWDTATSTWEDADSDGVIDPGEFLLVGGWTTHPVAAVGPDGSARLVVGAIPSGVTPSGAYTGLFELDLSRTPGQAGFIVQQTAAAGSTPAMLGAGVYSVGTGGLAALGARPPRADVDGDGRVDIDDLHAWERGEGSLDIDRSGVTDGADRDYLVYELRRNELRAVRGGG